MGIKFCYVRRLTVNYENCCLVIYMLAVHSTVCQCYPRKLKPKRNLQRESTAKILFSKISLYSVVYIRVKYCVLLGCFSRYCTIIL